MSALDLNCPAESATPAEAIAASYSAARQWLDAAWAPDTDARKSLFSKALYGSLDDLLQRHPLTNNTLFDDAIANKDACVLLALVSRLAFLTTNTTTESPSSSPCIGSTSEQEDGEETEDEEIAAVSLTRIYRPVRLSSWVEIEELPAEPATPECTHPDCDLPGNRHCSEGQCQRHCIERLISDENATCRVSYHRARARAEAQEQEKERQRRKRRRAEEAQAQARSVKRSKRIRESIKNRH